MTSIKNSATIIPNFKGNKNYFKQKEIESHEQSSIVMLSTNPLVDGTNLTVNEDIKYRRKRLVSPVRKYKHPNKSKEFIDYCEKLVSHPEDIECHPSLFRNILSQMRTGNSTISSGYRDAINNNLDIVVAASQIKLRELRRSHGKKKVPQMKSNKQSNKTQEFIDYCKQLVNDPMSIKQHPAFFRNLLSNIRTGSCSHLSSGYLKVFENNKALVKAAAAVNLKKVKATNSTKIVNKVNKNSIKAAKRASQWIKDLQNNNEDAISNYTYICHFRNWINAKPMPEAIKQVFDKNEKTLQEYKVIKDRFYKRTTAKTTTYTKEEPKITVCEKPTIEKPETQANTTIPDTLSMLISLAKKAGATEVTIKF